MDGLHGGAGRGKVNPDLVVPDNSPPAPSSGGTVGGKTKGGSKEARDYLGDMEAGFARRVSDFSERDQIARDRTDEREAQDAQREAERLAAERERGTAQAGGLARGIIGDADPVAKIQEEAAAKQAALDEALNNQYLTEDLWAQATIELHAKKEEQLRAISEQRKQAELANTSMMLMGASQGFGAMADIIGQFAGKQSTAYKAMFAVSKAFAIADSLVKIQQGIANAMSLPWPLNLGAAASTAAAAAGIVSTIKGTSFGGGRQYGGPVSAGTMYRVNETGRPEMFTAKNGAQYMLPTASGDVTPANKVGGGAGGGSSSQSASPNVAISMALQGVAMPDGWFAIRPEQAAEAVKSAYRDGWMAGFRG